MDGGMAVMCNSTLDKACHWLPKRAWRGYVKENMR